MDRETLRRLEMLNQLSLTESEKENVIAFFGKREAEMSKINSIDTKDVERMVHVRPILTVVREDVVKQNFSREDLQKGAPETMDGFWQVPRVVE